jgi:hypothetical protein
LGAIAISNSYGAGEYGSEASDELTYFNHPGIAVTASSGDNGFGVSFPAASRYVTAVGGTTLNQATNTGTRNGTETVWSGAGGGCSAVIVKPTWQTDTGCPRRAVADVSAVADPNTGVWVYDSMFLNSDPANVGAWAPRTFGSWPATFGSATLAGQRYSLYASGP